jgi:tetratricopeptide (TPR) repeat protein
MSPLLRLLAVAAVLFFAVAPAAAEDKATKTAKKHFAKGEKLFALGRFDDALVEYEAAFEAKPLPGFLFNIGQCHRNLGDYDAAIFSFNKYLRLLPDADDKDDVLALIDELEAKQAAEAKARDERRFDPEPGPKARKKPIYKKWWFWGGIAAVAGAGTGTFLLLNDDGVPNTDLGNVVFR